MCECVYALISLHLYLTFPSCTPTHPHPPHVTNSSHTHTCYRNPHPLYTYTLLPYPPHHITLSPPFTPPTFSKNQSGANPLPSCSTVTLLSCPKSRHKRDTTSTDPRSKLYPCRGDRQRESQTAGHQHNTQGMCTFRCVFGEQPLLPLRVRKTLASVPPPLTSPVCTSTEYSTSFSPSPSLG